MNQTDMFINRRYLGSLGDYYQPYFNNNGIFKKCLSSFFNKNQLNKEDLWYRLDDLPDELYQDLKDVAISSEEMLDIVKRRQAGSNVFDSSGVLIYVSDETPILPVVGNILPDDGTPAYTVRFQEGNSILVPIVVCWGCHWSELFTGQTKYGTNVFCLTSDLSKEQIDYFIDDIILLKEAPDYLNDQIKLDDSKIY